MAANIQSVNDRTTLIKIQVQETEYNAGNGSVTEFKTLNVQITDNITTDCFYVNWQNAFGNNAIQLQADGVHQPARVRMPFVRKVYEALQTKNCKILRYGNPNDAFMLNSSVDNIGEKCKVIEFQVKRWEDK